MSVTNPQDPELIGPAELAAYHQDGFHIARGLFSADEVAACRHYFDEFAARGEAVPGHWEPTAGASDSADPLTRYPRVIHPHMFDEASRDRLIDARLQRMLRVLLDDEPLAVQTMYYYKPPGARGQAFHQDNFYLRVKPQSCIAAWIAIDPSFPENGGLQVVPGSHDLDVACPDYADPEVSFTRDFVAPTREPVKLHLEPGDTLFFNGSVIHGSDPNSTAEVWRRSFICHYMPTAATHIAKWYLPHAIDFDGNPIAREHNGDGGPCGEDDTDHGGQYH
ncbi:MAG: phytanoyl-CoA dioxygenase family protein [Mycobacteriales bacterium]